MAKRVCENCGDKVPEDVMIATPNCEWICPECFAEDPESYGFDFDLDRDDLTTQHPEGGHGR